LIWRNGAWTKEAAEVLPFSRNWGCLVVLLFLFGFVALKILYLLNKNPSFELAATWMLMALVGIPAVWRLGVYVLRRFRPIQING
jgi:predicted ABC-type exoprotein transport system permease subunit